MKLGKWGDSQNTHTQPPMQTKTMRPCFSSAPEKKWNQPYLVCLDLQSYFHFLYQMSRSLNPSIICKLFNWYFGNSFFNQGPDSSMIYVGFEAVHCLQDAIKKRKILNFFPSKHFEHSSQTRINTAIKNFSCLP